ncbi:MAG: hypothetical protein ACREFX_06850, partial [Opitutaceae bacterium]
EQVVSYRIPKEPDDAASAMPPGAAPMAGGGPMSGPVPTASGPGLVWTAPAAWKAYPPQPERKANYRVGSDGAGELSITAFPGSVGGELANVNRWRGQAGLPPVADGGLASAVTRIEADGLRITVVDADGPDSHLLGAIVPLGDSTWFFKLTGPSALVAREKAAFLDFLKTVQPAVSS